MDRCLSENGILETMDTLTKRYIARGDVELFFKRHEWDTPDERWRPESEFGEFVDAIPDADVAPVVHAHKVRAHSQGGRTHWVICSNCEKPIDWEDSYCKHCGAKMDGDHHA